MALKCFSSDKLLFWAGPVKSAGPSETLLVRLECVEMETKEEQGRSVQDQMMWLEGTHSFGRKRCAFQSGILGKKKKIFPLLLVLKNIFQGT